jgi:hypothetical protein
MNHEEDSTGSLPTAMFICPECGASHYDSSPLYDANMKVSSKRIYSCKGNEWKGTPRCGWTGDIAPFMVTMRLDQKMALENQLGKKDFYDRLKPKQQTPYG